jgi:CHASE2 domain-containing sensor protein/two-component sensor histidine kinase
MQRILWQWLQKEWQVWRVGALPGLAVIGLVVLLRAAGALQFLELTLLDGFLRLRPAEPMDERILIVGIDDADIRQIGQYPIPDREIVSLLKTIQSHQPSVVGLDIFRDYTIPAGQTELADAFKQSKNWVAIAAPQLFPGDRQATPPPATVPSDQVGFANAMVDGDGFLRRSLLSSTDVEGEFYWSLTARLAKRYLESHGQPIDNGIRDSEAFRFGKTELQRFQANTGGYVGGDDGENQILINFRSGQRPFRTISLTDIKNGNFKPEWMRDRIVLVGITSDVQKDFVNSAAIVKDNPGFVPGVEVQAHAVSQITSAVLDGRSLLNTLSDPWEYLWIVAWGLLGLSLGRISQSPLRIFLGLGGTSIVLIGACYWAILGGWWLPVVPAFMAMFLNGAGLTAALFYRQGQDLQTQIAQRQVVINQTFDAIHSGPLQTLSSLLRTVKSQSIAPETLLLELQKLDDEMRSVWESVRRETLMQDHQLRLSSEVTLDMNASLQEAFSELFHVTLQRDLPHFKTLKVQVPDIEPLDERFLTVAQKQMICRFVEESLCNVGKHAIGATSLRLVCRQEQGENLIQVIDDGQGVDNRVEPLDKKQLLKREKTSNQNSLRLGGTRQAQELARQLGGRFERSHTSTGTVCQLRWRINRR